MTHIDCSICSERFSEDNEVVVITTCGHLFHKACLCPWLQRSQTCPQCRNNCTDDDMRTVYFNIDANATASPIDNAAMNELLDGANIQVLETEWNLSKADDQIRALTQSQQNSSEAIIALTEKLQEKDGAILSYVEELSQLKEDIVYLQINTSSFEIALQTCESKKTDLNNVIETLQVDLCREIEMRKKSEESVAELEIEYSTRVQEDEYVLRKEISALKSKLETFEQTKDILQQKDCAILSYREQVTGLKEMIVNLQFKVSSQEIALETRESEKADLQSHLSRETQMRKKSEERFAQLESESSIAIEEGGNDLREEVSALKSKLKRCEQEKVILSSRLEETQGDLCKETEIKKNSEGRLAQLESKLIMAVIERNNDNTQKNHRCKFYNMSTKLQ